MVTSASEVQFRHGGTLHEEVEAQPYLLRGDEKSFSTDSRCPQRADAERVRVVSEDARNIVTRALLGGFAKAARERIRLPNGGCRRDHLRALAQRVEVADREDRIVGPKGELLRTLAAVSDVKPNSDTVRNPLRLSGARILPRRMAYCEHDIQSCPHDADPLHALPFCAHSPVPESLASDGRRRDSQALGNV